MDRQLNNLITEFGNGLFVVSGCTVVFGILYWAWTRRIQGENLAIMATFAGVVAMFTIRIAWWIPSLKMAPGGVNYHQFFLDWKWLLTFVSSVLCTLLVYVLFNKIDRFSTAQTVWFFAVTLLFSFGIFLI